MLKNRSKQRGRFKGFEATLSDFVNFLPIFVDFYLILN
jgi:hypothetical protein